MQKKRHRDASTMDYFWNYFSFLWCLSYWAILKDFQMEEDVFLSVLDLDYIILESKEGKYLVVLLLMFWYTFQPVVVYWLWLNSVILYEIIRQDEPLLYLLTLPWKASNCAKCSCWLFHDTPVRWGNTVSSLFLDEEIAQSKHQRWEPYKGLTGQPERITVTSNCV